MLSKSLLNISKFILVFIFVNIYTRFQIYFLPETLLKDFYTNLNLLNLGYEYLNQNLSFLYYLSLIIISDFINPIEILTGITSISLSIIIFSIINTNNNLYNSAKRIMILLFIPIIPISFISISRFGIASSIAILVYILIQKNKIQESLLLKVLIPFLSFFSVLIHLFTLPLIILPLLPNNLNFLKSSLRFINKMKIEIFNSSIKRPPVILLSSFFIFTASIGLIKNIDFLFLVRSIQKFIGYFLDSNLDFNYSLFIIPLICIFIVLQNKKFNNLILDSNKILIFCFSLIFIYPFITALWRYFIFIFVVCIGFMPRIRYTATILSILYGIYLNALYFI